jgi:DNA helicase II / ATP-dependent DNA helicase PcrA
MRLPKLSQLTTEQKAVYLYAPTDEHVLVHGPPGTGKTLIACLRAIELQKRKVPVILGMFSRVLARYSSNVGEGKNMPSQTVIRWFGGWWKSTNLPPHPSASSRFALQVGFDEKEKAKAAGARWSPEEWVPWKKTRGSWVVNSEQYFSSPQSFSEWKLSHNPPTKDGNVFRLDWDSIAAHLLEHEEFIPDHCLNLGCILVDEGQDFSPGFYKTLRQLGAIGAARGTGKVPHPAKCFVLADENQQLTEDNSTLDDISKALRISKENQYQLLDNFRNSRQVAELAASFFADVGKIPKIPKRSTNRPTYSQVSSRGDVVERIKLWATNNPRKEAGVFLFDDRVREEIALELSRSLSSMKGRQIKVQTYSWKSKDQNPVDELLFDAPDVVTVLNVQSCKGLEFDAAFIIDSQDANIGLYGPDRYRMQMFVAVSRARDDVFLIDSGARAGKGPYFEILPGPPILERVSRANSVGRNSNAPPKRSEPLPAPKSTRATATEGSEDTVLELAKKQDWKVKDLRPKGGAFWVEATIQSGKALEQLGFKFHPGRGEWWKK